MGKDKISTNQNPLPDRKGLDTETNNLHTINILPTFIGVNSGQAGGPVPAPHGEATEITEEHYPAFVEQVRQEIQDRIGKAIKIEWRKSEVNSGLAYNMKTHHYLICPYPTTLEKMATCFHEIGHVLNDNEYYCLREYNAEIFAIQTLQRFDIEPTPYIIKKHFWYMAYSLGQALNRKMKNKNIPVELRAYKKHLKEWQVQRYCNGRLQTVKRYYAKNFNKLRITKRDVSMLLAACRYQDGGPAPAPLSEQHICKEDKENA